MRYLPHSFYLRGSKISVEPHQMYIYHMSKKSRPSLQNLRHCFVFHYWYVTQNLSVYSVTPRTLCHLRVQTYQNIFVYESSNYEHLSETILDIRDAKWFIYFECLSTLLSLYRRICDRCTRRYPLIFGTNRYRVPPCNMNPGFQSRIRNPLGSMVLILSTISTMLGTF